MTHSSAYPRYPNVFVRVGTVWYRHARVYSSRLISNIASPLLDPMFFVVAMGLGLGAFVQELEGLPYMTYIAIGIMMTAAATTAMFECSYGTFIRLSFDKTYDGMLTTPLNPHDILMGELLWAATKGVLFSASNLLVMVLLGIVPINLSTWWILFAPFLGGLSAICMACFSFIVVSFAKNIDQMSLYVTLAFPVVFFVSGANFPISQFPKAFRWVAEMVPITHVVRMNRALFAQDLTWMFLGDLFFVLMFMVLIGYLSIRILLRRLVD